MYDPFDSPGFPFGDESKKALESVHPKLRLIVMTVIIYQNVTIREGYRDQETQERKFAENLTKVHWPNSRHNSYPSRAIHILPYPVDWSQDYRNLVRYYHLAGRVKQIADALGIRIRWGGDWDSDLDFSDQKFDDLGHYELADDE